MIIPDNYVEYRSQDGKYLGYFEIDKAPENWYRDDQVFISSKEFMDYFYVLDTVASDAMSQTYEHFMAKYPTKDRVYEDRNLSKSALIKLIKNELQNDLDRVDIFGIFGDGYNDWQFIDSLNTAWDELTSIYDFYELLLEVTGGVNLDTYVDEPETFFKNNKIDLK